MKKKSPSLFRLSIKERNGIQLLTGLIFILFLAWQLLRLWPQESSDSDAETFQTAWQNFKRLQSKKYGSGSVEKSSSPSNHFVLQDFDPNTADRSSLLKLGLPQRTVNTILNYRKQGGRFYKPEDFKKIYTLSNADYKKLAAYIHIRQTSEMPEHQSPPIQALIIDLNTTGTERLSRLPGMPYGLAKRLLEFRDYLGGFYAVDQVLDLYGFPDSLFQKIKNQLRISSENIRKINLNRATVKQLEDHPYITRSLTSQLITLRKKLNHLDSVQQIKELSLINEENYRKIAPYLETD